MSLFGPSPPSLPSAPSELISYGAFCAGETYLYSLPHGSFGTDDFFQYGPFQFVTPAGAADQRLQAFLRGRVTADFELVEIERLADLADLDLCGVGLGLFSLADEVAADDAEHDADQHEHDENFDQASCRRCDGLQIRTILVPLYLNGGEVDASPRGIR